VDDLTRMAGAGHASLIAADTLDGYRDHSQGDCMRKAVVMLMGALAGTAVLAAGPAPNTLSPAEKAEGWSLLFDGKTTTGWRAFKAQHMPDGWSVVDGALVRTGKGGDIITVDTFDSFDLKFDWRIAKNGNSGVFFHVTEAPDAAQVWHTGPEYQILDNDGHRDARNGPDRFAGANYALHPPSKHELKPVGQWNESRIVVKGAHVEHWLNGAKVVEYELGSPDWEQRVNASKFKDTPRYGREKRGHIALQDHGDEVAFRNIKIRRLGQS
jgi:hypothetical protein